MHRIEKKFTVPIGHRLSKHKGRCKNIHGHNFTILVGLKKNVLNDNDMVMDFSELKKIVNEIIDEWDHCTLLNEEDSDLIETFSDMRCIAFPFDPTAERLSRVLFETISQRLTMPIQIDYVTMYENENSKATYSLD